MRGRTIALFAVLALAASAALVLAYDRLAALELARPLELSSSGFEGRFVCTRHPISRADWRIEGTTETGATWRSELPRPGHAEAFPVDRGSGLGGFVVIGASANRPARDPSFVVVLEPEDDGCYGTPLSGGEELDPEEGEDVPEWLEVPAEEPEEPAPTKRSRHGLEPDGDEGEAPASGIALLEMLRMDGRHAATHARGSITQVERTGTCLVDPAQGVRWCAETETRAIDRAHAGGAVVEVLDLAPRVLVAHDESDGRVRWRREVPTDAAAVWLVRGEDGGLGLRANEDYFALDVATGEIVRVTPAGGSVCDRGVVVSLADGVLAATPRSPAVLAIRARPGPSELAACVPWPTDDSIAVVVVAAGPSGPVAEPRPILDLDAPLVGGTALYVLGPDGSLRSAWTLPWARDVLFELGELVATTPGAERAPLVVRDGVLQLRDPDPTPSAP